MNTLAKKNTGMVRAIALQLKRRLGARVDLEDLEALGMEGLFTASRRYRMDGGASFATFAGYRVRGAMLDALPQITRLRRDEAHDVEEELGADEDAEQQSLARETSEQVRAAIARLPQRERDFIDRVYFAGEPMARAGARLGLSRSWASRIHGRAVRRLRDALREAA